MFVDNDRGPGRSIRGRKQDERMKKHWTEYAEHLQNELCSEVCNECKYQGRVSYYDDSPVESPCDDCQVEMNDSGDFYMSLFSEK